MISLFVQDWKTGDRVLAKWQDCKFYPAKITKCLNDGKKPVNVIWREVCGCQNRTKILALAPFNESKDSIVWTVLFQRCYKTKQTKKRGKLLAPNKSEKKKQEKRSEIWHRVVVLSDLQVTAVFLWKDCSKLYWKHKTKDFPGRQTIASGILSLKTQVHKPETCLTCYGL